MPHLDITDQEQYIHLLQLYYAAHPHLRASNEHVRRQTGEPDAYFVAPADAPRLMRWALAKHLVTRRAAAEYVDVCANMLKPIAAVVRPILVKLGDPPREQLGIRASEIFTWISMHSVASEDGDRVLTVAAALTLLDGTAADADEPRPVRARAAQLADWLRAQPTLC